MTNRLFISDLHLDNSRPEVIRAFFDWLQQWRGKASELYILGDFFEIWLGDDAAPPLAQEIAKALQSFAAAGTRIFIMHGNRDFLLGDHYAQQCAAELIQEPYTITLGEQRVLLMHGDTLCTEDKAYIDFRNQVRNEAWQQAFLAKPIAERIAFGQKARATSQQDSKYKSDAIMDVTPDEVAKAMTENGVRTMIHGHTHRPNRHKLTTELGPSERIVLGDWHQMGWFLLHNSQGFSLQSFPIAP